jgi:hypothetical protein
MLTFLGKLFSKTLVSNLPAWALIPDLGAGKVRGTRTWYSSDPAEEIDLALLTCTCSSWKERKRDLAERRSVGRCCDHMVRVVYDQILTRGLHADAWLIAILKGAYQEWAPPAHFEYRFFSNGESDFLALYDTSRGYVQLYGPPDAPVQIGYDSSRNRWSHGTGPNNPLVIKKTLRPWIKALDLKYGFRTRP